MLREQVAKLDYLITSSCGDVFILHVRSDILGLTPSCIESLVRDCVRRWWRDVSVHAV